jgi:hypothetical protein
MLIDCASVGLGPFQSIRDEFAQCYRRKAMKNRSEPINRFERVASANSCFIDGKQYCPEPTTCP